LLDRLWLKCLVPTIWFEGFQSLKSEEEDVVLTCIKRNAPNYDLNDSRGG